MDKQEREIIASLEMEEREHKKYMETVQSMKGEIVSELLADQSCKRFSTLLVSKSSVDLWRFTLCR